MLLQCSACKRSFREPGFCPYDGVKLLVIAEHAERPTVESGQQAAQPSVPPYPATIDNPTELDDRHTLPLTPSGPPSAPPSPTSENTNIVRALSAADNTDAAIRALRQRTEYDRLVGETLDGRYFVQRKIGEGGMGVVFAVRHAVIERPLAVKVLKREVMRDDATLRRFVQEARAASRIGHPNIVDVTDFGKTAEGLTYCVMELVDGQTLAHTIRHASPFQLVRVLRIAAQIARALGVAHDKGIVHRDLKPENVFLVDRDGRPDFVKIVDFGIAKVAPLPGDASANQPRLTKVGSVFGTPEYMAPEQAAGRGDTDGRVDIYALGVILYEMLTGKVPHKGDSMVRTLAMQMLDPIVPPSHARPDLHISPEVEAVVMMALAKKRDQRYQTMGELLAALEVLAKHVLPAPVGASATGSPVYQLMPLPPGASESAVMQAAGSALRQVAAPSPPREPGVGDARRSGAASEPRVAGSGREGGTAQSPRRIKDEPRFVSADRPARFVIEQAEAERGGSRWGVLLLSVLAIAAVTTAAVTVIVKKRNEPLARQAALLDAALGSSRDVAQAPPSDGSVVALTEIDGSTPAAPADAAIAQPRASDGGMPPAKPVDARVIAHTHAPDHGPKTSPGPGPGPGPRPGPGSGPGPRRGVDAGTEPALTIDTPNHRGTISITVMTKPDTAQLYVGTAYHGPGGTSLEETYGTRYEVQCRAAGYKPGKLWLTFDGKTEVALCVLQRIKICIDNLKNPFDDCEVDPTRPSPDHTVQTPPGPPAPP